MFLYINELLTLKKIKKTFNIIKSQKNKNKMKMKNLSRHQLILLELIIAFKSVEPLLFDWKMPTFLSNNAAKPDDKLQPEDDNIDQSPGGNGLTVSSLDDFIAQMTLNDIFKQSLSNCSFSKSLVNANPTNNNNSARKQESSIRLDEKDSSKRLFVLDETTVGLVASTAIKFYSLNQNGSISHLKTFTFIGGKTLTDACTDKSRSLFTLFSGENKTVKYIVNRNAPNSIKLYKSRSLYETDFKPTAIRCTDQLVYVSSKKTNQVRVFNRMFESVDEINIKNVIVTLRRLAVDSNVRVFTDDHDAVAFFGKNNETACHFHLNLDCIEDIDVYTENNSTSSVYVVDSCANNVKQFMIVTSENRIDLKNVYTIKSGVPVSSVKSAFNRLIVLTKHPNQIIHFIL